MAKNYDKTFIENYLLNRLTEEERAAFLKKMEEEEEFRREVALHENMLKVLLHEKNSAIKKRLEKEEKEMNKSEAHSSKTTVRRKLGIRALVATLILLAVLVAVVWLSRQDNSPATPQALFSPHPNTYYLQVKSGDEAGEDLLREVFQAYENEDYQKAADLFPKVVSPDDPYRYNDLLFYRANTLMALDRSAEAIPMLELIISTEKTSYLSNAKWYLALAYLMNGQQERAQALLEELTKNSFYKDKAKRLLKK